MPRLLFTMVILALVASPSLARAQAPAKSDSAMIAAGKALFEGRGLCATCHGKQGEGLLGPTLQLNGGKAKWLHTDGSAAAIVALIKSGLDASDTKLGMSMPPRGGARLTDAQVDQVAAYVLALHAIRPAPSRDD